MREIEEKQRALENKRNEFRSKTKTVLDKVDLVPEKFAGSERKPKKPSSKFEINLRNQLFQWFIDYASYFFLEKRKQYEDDGLINDNESDAEAGSALKKQRKPKKKRGIYKSTILTFDYL